ncbi:MAG: helix-turn-helix transcriptional regulator [Armatimonadota bacterium]
MTLEEQFERLIRTLQLIESDPWKWDVAGLELEFNVGHATVERDIHILRKWGTIKRRDGYFAIKDLRFLPSSLTASEVLSLVMAGGMVAERIGMPHTSSLYSALRKINSLLPEKVDSMIGKMKERVSIGVNLVRDCNSEILDDISKAIPRHNPIDISYYVTGRNELTERRVNPYGLTFRFGAWYLIGWCCLRQDVRTFGVDRIRSIKPVDSHFKYPKDFDLDEYLKRGWSLQADALPENIVLRFNKEITPWITGCSFHPNQEITVQDDGSSIFEVTVAGIDEIKHWVLSFGNRVEVLGPESLRQSVIETYRDMSRVYDQ